MNVRLLSCSGFELSCVVQSLLERGDHQKHDYSQTQSPTHDVITGGAAHEVCPEVGYRNRYPADQTQVETSLLANACEENRQEQGNCPQPHKLG